MAKKESSNIEQRQMLYTAYGILNEASTEIYSILAKSLRDGKINQDLYDENCEVLDKISKARDIILHTSFDMKKSAGEEIEKYEKDLYDMTEKNVDGVTFSEVYI